MLLQEVRHSWFAIVIAQDSSYIIASYKLSALPARYSMRSDSEFRIYCKSAQSGKHSIAKPREPPKMTYISMKSKDACPSASRRPSRLVNRCQVVRNSKHANPSQAPSRRQAAGAVAGRGNVFEKFGEVHADAIGRNKRDPIVRIFSTAAMMRSDSLTSLIRTSHICSTSTS